MKTKEAYEILGLKDDAPRIEVEKRYSILLRKMKNNRDNFDMDFNKITDAYNQLMGYNFVEDETGRAPRRTSPTLKKLGIDQDKLMNNLYYFKTHIIIGIILLITIILSVRGCVNRVIPDIDLVILGDIYSTDTDQLEIDLKAKIEGIEAIGIENLMVSAAQEKQDPQVQMAMMQKAMVLIAAGDIDLFIVDKINFDRYAVQGGFLKLDDLAKKFDLPDEKQLKAKVEDEDEREYIYGFDISNSKILKDGKVLGKKMIATISVKSKHYENALKLLELLLIEPDWRLTNKFNFKTEQ